MYRLRGSDAQLIYNETPSSPFETLKVTIYESVDPNTPVDVAELIEFLMNATRNTKSEGPSMRVMRVPWDLHHPVWVKDPNYCLEDHYRHRALPAPGNKEQLCDFLSSILSRPLDRSRPLWETWVVEGLEGGRVACVSKVHHVLADGLTSVKGFERMHSEAAAKEQAETQGEAAAVSAPDPIPSRRRLIIDALVELFKSYTIELPVYWRHIKKMREGSAKIKEGEPNVAAPFSGPFTVLNQPGGPYRHYYYDMYSLAQIKALSKRKNCTINTLIMALCSEGLKRYFEEIDDMPSEPLVSVMPVGLAGQGEIKKLFNTEIQNNSLTVALIPFDLSVDFDERLAKIQHASQVAVANVKKSEGYRMDNFFDFLPGSFIRLVNAITAWRLRNKKSPIANLALSNVPGPREVMYACNKKYKVAELLSCGNLAEGANFTLTIWSYLDQLCFSFHYRKGALPSPHSINKHVADVIQEMLAAEGIGEGEA